MNNHFPKLAMAKFSEQFKGQKLQSMHNTNPKPFGQYELEQTIGMSFSEILQDVNLGFAPDAGTVGLRNTLAHHHYEIIESDEIITHAGAQEALFCVFSALLKPKDRVLIVAPVFEPLVQIPLNMKCHVSYLQLDNENNWSLNFDEVEAEFIKGCQLFVINFPHNPTGATLSRQELLKLVNLCKKYDVWLLSDEVFRGLEHSLNLRLPAVADYYDKGISVGVISKAFAIPGIRIGWLACQNEQLRKKIIDVKGYLSICNSQLDEKLAAVLLQKPEKLLERNLEIIVKNKPLLKEIKELCKSSINIAIPHAGCCVFAEIKNGNLSAGELAKQLALKTGYLLYPSSLFKTKTQALRIGFGTAEFSRFVKLSSLA